MPDRAVRVLKFGGSSVGSVAGLKQVLDIVARVMAGADDDDLGVAATAPEPTGAGGAAAEATSHRARAVSVVVSAMGDSTDVLLRAVRAAGEGRGAEAEAALASVGALAVSTAAAVSGGGAAAELRFAALIEGVITRAQAVLRSEAFVRARAPAVSDAVVAVGERVSVAIVSALLAERGMRVLPVDATEWVLTDEAFGAARVDVPATLSRARAAAAASWPPGVVAVHTGFIGATCDGRTTTLGRNGSDYTAALLASALRASCLSVWTDVLGVMTADPGLVAEAYPVRHLSHGEALELANLGFTMFHPHTMVPLMDAAIPLRIRSTTALGDTGTLVDAGGDPAGSVRPTCIVTLEGLAQLDIEYAARAPASAVGISQRVHSALEAAGVASRLSTQSPLGRAGTVVVQAVDLERARSALAAALADDLARGDVQPPRVHAPVTLVTVMLSPAAAREPNMAGRFFSALGGVGIKVLAFAHGGQMTSASVVIAAAETALAARTIHAAFNLALTEVSVLAIGKGVVGEQLIAHIGSEAAKLVARDGVRVRVVGIVGSDRALFDERGIDLTAWRERYAGAPGPGAAAASPATVGTVQALLPLLDRLARLPVPIITDCTAADGMERLYEAAFARGIHVAAANKKPLATPLAARNALMACAAAHHRRYLYETTVGAALPVLTTLNDIVRTGDRVRLVEGSFSGTLGYLVNELMDGVPLSAAVSNARAKGFTEPHPREDLTGLDVARKALILARELGLELELEDIAVEPLVPHEALGEDDVDAFLTGLTALDAGMAARIESLRAEGKVLRYLACIDPLAPGGRSAMARVGPIAVPASHAAARLRGSQAFVSFTTERYADYPLVVQGAGAGGAVTAGGVLADVLKIAQTLRGR